MSRKSQEKCAKKRKKIGGGSCPPGKCFFLGGGKCPNLGVVNVRILGVVNVLLANDSQSYSRAPQINQKTEFWYFTLTTGSYMKDEPQEQASANTQIPYLGVFGLFEYVF